MPHSRLPATPPAVSAKSAASDVLAALDTQDFLAQLLAQQTPFGELAVVSSFGAESAVLLHLVATLNPKTRVVFLDTGFHFPETLAYRDELIARLELQGAQTIGIDPLSEKRYDESATLHQIDPDRCCAVRKVQVLRRALRPYGGWISGQKQFHSSERARLERVEWDDIYTTWKFNPLADWSADRIASYQAEHRLPAHPLVSEGYPSIGCEPCTSRVAGGEELRAGRWRGQDKLECGLHRNPNVIAVSSR